MPAGYDQYGYLYRPIYSPDDIIGGAVPSGTLQYDFVPMRIEPIKPTMALMEQGLETPHFYTVALQANAQIVRENDEIEVTMPIESWYYGYRMRIVSVQHASIRPRDPREQTIVIDRRLDEAHGKNNN